MPSERVLPPGPPRRFAEELFHLFRLARRPPLWEISYRIQHNNDLDGTASRETLRRMLTGKTVPSWKTAFAAFTTLCDLAEVDPSSARYVDNNRYESDSYLEAFESAWNDAHDYDPLDRPRVSRVETVPDNPWGSASSTSKPSYDEPPF